MHQRAPLWSHVKRRCSPRARRGCENRTEKCEKLCRWERWELWCVAFSKYCNANTTCKIEFRAASSCPEQPREDGEDGASFLLRESRPALRIASESASALPNDGSREQSRLLFVRSHTYKCAPSALGALRPSACRPSCGDIELVLALVMRSPEAALDLGAQRQRERQRTDVAIVLAFANVINSILKRNRKSTSRNSSQEVEAYLNTALCACRECFKLNFSAARIVFPCAIHT